MKKLLISILLTLLILAGAYVGMAWKLGQDYEKGLATRFERWNNQPSVKELGVMAKIDRMEHSLFSTNAHYNISSTLLPAVKIPVSVQVKHGPIINLQPARFQETHTLDNDGLTNLWYKLTEGKVPISMTNNVTFAGDNKMTWELSPFSWSLVDQRIEFSGLTSHVNIDSNKHMVGDYALGHINVLNRQNVILAIRDLKGNFDTHTDKIKSGFPEGSYLAEIGTIITKGILQLNSISLEYKGTQKGDIAHIAQPISIGKIEVAGDDMGSLKALIETENLNIALYKEIQEKLQRGDKSAALDILTNDLLKNKPSIKFDGQWNTNVGKIESNLKIVGRSKQPVGQEILDHIDHLDSHVVIPKDAFIKVVDAIWLITNPADKETAHTMAQNIWETLQKDPRAQIFFHNVGNTLVSDMTYDGQDRITINGKNFTVAEFLNTALNPKKDTQPEQQTLPAEVEPSDQVPNASPI